LLLTKVLEFWDRT